MRTRMITNPAEKQKPDRLLFRKTKDSRWALFETSEKTPVIFAGHVRCSRSPRKEDGYVWLSWVPEEDPESRCYRCNALVPEEIQALALLYMKEQL